MVIYVDGFLPIQNATVTSFTTTPFVATDGMKKIVGEFHENVYSADSTPMAKVTAVTMIIHVSKINNIIE